MKTINYLETAILDALSTLKTQYGGDADLSEDAQAMSDVSAAVDQANETWNENLPTRPSGH